MAEKKKEKKKKAKSAVRRGPKTPKKSKNKGAEKTPAKTSKSAKDKRPPARRVTKRIRPAAASGSERETLVVTPAIPLREEMTGFPASGALVTVHDEETLEILEAPEIEDEEDTEW